MNRNLDKDDIRDASDLLTHIDGWEKTGRYYQGTRSLA